MNVRWTRRAWADLQRIARHIAEDNPPAAARFTRLLAVKVAVLQEHPLLGRHGSLRRDLHSETIDTIEARYCFFGPSQHCRPDHAGSTLDQCREPYRSDQELGMHLRLRPKKPATAGSLDTPNAASRPHSLLG